MVFSTPSRLPSSCTSPDTAFTNGALSGVMISVKFALQRLQILRLGNLPRAAHIGLGMRARPRATAFF